MEMHQCLTAYGIAQVTPGTPFKVIVANLGKTTRTLLKRQTIASAKPHPTTLHESGISHADILGLAIEQPQHSSNDGNPNAYRKRQYNVRDTDTINQHLADMRESHMEEDERLTRAEDIGLAEVEKKHHERIRTILKKNDST